MRRIGSVVVGLIIGLIIAFSAMWIYDERNFRRMNSESYTVESYCRIWYAVVISVVPLDGCVTGWHHLKKPAVDARR